MRQWSVFWYSQRGRKKGALVGQVFDGRTLEPRDENGNIVGSPLPH